MEIKILGTGCPKCKNLEKITREVVEQNGFEATITKVDDIEMRTREDVIAQDMERDFFMSAQEAVEYGVVDQVMARRKHGAQK